MLGVLNGFATIALVIGLGAFLAHIRLVDLTAQALLLRLSFFVASPALMVLTIGEADVGTVLSTNLAASAASVVVTGAIYATSARLAWHRDAGDTTIGVLASTYVNAGNLGIPVAAYVLGDASLVAPTLLMQLLVIQPLAMTVLDRGRDSGGSRSARRIVTGPLRNPLTVGSLIGLVLALTGFRLPTAIHDPVELLGHMAVPSMLIGYGIALRLGPGLGAGGSRAELATTTLLKLVVQPVVAYAVARLLGVEGLPLLAIVVTAALPTAQNIFVHATRYDRRPDLARDTILLTTAGCVPVILLAALLLG